MIKLSFFKFNFEKITGKCLLYISIISFVIIFDSFGVCQMDKINTSKETQQKEELKESDTVKVIPYTQGISSETSTKTETSQTKLGQIVTGLKEAGYSLGEIAGILKNDNNDAQTISIACLKQGYTAGQVYSALLKAGFSRDVADKIIPASLRNDSNILTVVGIADNIDAKVLQNDAEAATPAEVLEVPVSVGVTFNGLGSWGQFQDNRFK